MRVKLEYNYMRPNLILHRRLLETGASGRWLLNQTTLNDSYGSGDGGDSEFDTNMVIILAVLLCAALLALGFNTFARSGLRYIFRSTSSPQQPAAPGLNKRALFHLPVVVYESGADISTKELCPICLEEFVGGERIRVLPKCSHRFHVECIDTWLLSHASCPNCRLSILLEPQPAAPSPSTDDPSAGPYQHHLAVNISSQ